MSSAVKELKSGSGERDLRLDFWRGLCLVDMLIIHLISQGMTMGWWSSRILGEYTRFAAGGFIFLAGLGVSYIFLPKTQIPDRRWSTYRALWRRSLYLLGVHYAASLSFIFVWPLHDWSGTWPNAWSYVKEVLFFQEGCDLLIFYVMMVALAPPLLELIRRGYWWAGMILSFAIFALGQSYPYFLSLPIQYEFMVMVWQLVFAMGMLAGAFLPRYDALSRCIKVHVAIGLLVTLITLITLKCSGIGETMLGIHFAKVPLTWAEAARYMAFICTIIAVTDLFWHRIGASEVVGFFRRLGRRSLAVYVAHVWVVALIVSASRHLQIRGEWQMLLIIPAVALLWAWTCVLDSLTEIPRKRGEEPWIGQGFWKVSGAAVAGVAILFLLHSLLMVKPPDPHARLLAKVNPSNLAGYVDAGDADVFDVQPGPVPDLPYDDVVPDDIEV